MDVFQQLAGSNAFQIVFTVGAGGVAYFAINRFQWMIPVIAVVVTALLTFSFSLDFGEVYSYSPIYKRAYWWFGDSVTVWLGPLMIWAILARRPAISVFLAAGVVFSGGRVAIILLLLQYISVALILRKEAWEISRRFWGAVVFAVCAYAALIAVSPHLMVAGNWTLERVASIFKWERLGADGEVFETFAPALRGNGNCRELEQCFATKVARPFQYRAYGALAGLWMTLEGGYQGSRFPNTADKFADLMVEANPWGINDAFGIDREQWRRIGTIQTPYLQFGAGYGPWLLAVLVVTIGVIGFLGVLNIRGGEAGQGLAFTVFFIVNAVFNQTQAWMNPGPILFVMGLTGTHILLTFMRNSRGQAFSKRQPQDSSPLAETRR